MRRQQTSSKCAYDTDLRSKILRDEKISLHDNTVLRLTTDDVRSIAVTVQDRFC